MAGSRQLVPAALRLCLFAALCGAALAAIFVLTRDKIESAEAQAQMAALHALVPPDIYDNDLLQSVLRLSDSQGQPVLVYRATLHGALSRAVFQTSSSKGYSGPIDLFVAFDSNGTLRSTRVIHHRETPGLGDVIETEKSNWITQFFGASAASIWRLSEDGGSFDAVTGATVSSRAVVDALEKANELFSLNQAAILSGNPDA